MALVVVVEEPSVGEPSEPSNRDYTLEPNATLRCARSTTVALHRAFALDLVWGQWQTQTPVAVVVNEAGGVLGWFGDVHFEEVTGQLLSELCVKAGAAGPLPEYAHAEQTSRCGRPSCSTPPRMHASRLRRDRWPVRAVPPKPRRAVRKNERHTRAEPTNHRLPTLHSAGNKTDGALSCFRQLCEATNGG